jgi:hypothetical protein
MTHSPGLKAKYEEAVKNGKPGFEPEVRVLEI